MRLSLATWNVNSVRLRMPQIQAFLARTEIDILCLQEIKCQEHEFPYDAFRDLGFDHIQVAGQKGWHGVALVSKIPFESGDLLPFCRRGEARAQAIRIEGSAGAPVDIWNFYIPAGGDVPDRTLNDKFDHKLEFYERMCRHLQQRNRDHPLLICGDLNIAPGEYDVWSHRQMLKVVSHTPQEIDAFNGFMACGEFHDPFRVAYPEPDKIFTWWSYRAVDYRASNRGLRLDHILLNPALMTRVSKLTARIHDDVRGWTQPSDHVPAQVTFEI